MSPDERPRVGGISGRECGQPRSRHPENECFDVTFDPLKRLEPERSDVERAPKSVPGCSVNNDRAGLATALQASCEMMAFPATCYLAFALGRHDHHEVGGDSHPKLYNPASWNG